MLDDDCITRILDMLWSIKGAKYVNEFANIAPLDYHVLYFKDKAIADACDYFNVPDTITDLFSAIALILVSVSVPDTLIKSTLPRPLVCVIKSCK